MRRRIRDIDIGYEVTAGPRLFGALNLLFFPRRDFRHARRIGKGR